MKRIICAVLTILMLTVCAASLGETVPEEGQGVLYTAHPSAGSGGYCVMTMKDALRLTPDESFTGELEWSSDNTDVATVKDGLVLPAGAGKAGIVFTDGTATGLCTVLVNDMPTTDYTACGLRIELDGKTYESNLSVQKWKSLGEKPGRLKGTDGDLVRYAEGRFFIRTDCLLNIVCCALGKSRETEGAKGRLPQICGERD